MRGLEQIPMAREQKITMDVLKKALIRVVKHHGHYYHCSAWRGLESECHCGWIEIKALAKQISPAGADPHE